MRSSRWSRKVSPSVDPIDRARELFWMYDGSSFYMSRDGVDAEYWSYSVPKRLEKQWFEELTTSKLEKLESPDNWRVVFFLIRRSDTRHLPRLLQAKPVGAFPQRCVYLEELLRYVKMCARDHAVDQIEMRQAAEYVLDQARILDTEAGGEDSRYRVHRILKSAAELRASTQA
jgi:hypothetical protein